LLPYIYTRLKGERRKGDGMFRNKKGFVTGFELGFLLTTLMLVGISQLPGIKNDFREKKAKILCEEGYRGLASTNCEMAVSSWSKSEILAYIKDDIVVQQVTMQPRLGG